MDCPLKNVLGNVYVFDPIQQYKFRITFQNIEKLFSIRSCFIFDSFTTPRVKMIWIYFFPEHQLLNCQHDTQPKVWV